MVPEPCTVPCIVQMSLVRAESVTPLLLRFVVTRAVLLMFLLMCADMCRAVTCALLLMLLLLSAGADREVQRILMELLNQMDGFDQTVNVKVGHVTLLS